MVFELIVAMTEVFNSPTVERVIFQITFPSYFGIESKIGDFQLKIMNKFPNSKLLTKQSIIFAQGVDPIEKDTSGVGSSKIWQFLDEEEDIILNIAADSLDITSKRHKTYNNAGVSEEERFRETISFVVDEFLSVIQLTVINRIGFRYLDSKCPLPDVMSNESFSEYYNTSFDLDNLQIDDINKVVNLLSQIVILKPNDVQIKFKENLIHKDSSWSYNLDFDGSKSKIDPAEYLRHLDDIHEQTDLCYNGVIKEPVYSIMRQ